MHRFIGWQITPILYIHYFASHTVAAVCTFPEGGRTHFSTLKTTRTNSIYLYDLHEIAFRTVFPFIEPKNPTAVFDRFPSITKFFYGRHGVLVAAQLQHTILHNSLEKRKKMLNWYWTSTYSASGVIYEIVWHWKIRFDDDFSILLSKWPRYGLASKILRW